MKGIRSLFYWPPGRTDSLAPALAETVERHIRASTSRSIRRDGIRAQASGNYRYMIDNSDHLIAYAWHPGNARELVKYAERRENRGLIHVTVLPSPLG